MSTTYMYSLELERRDDNRSAIQGKQKSLSQEFRKSKRHLVWNDFVRIESDWQETYSSHPSLTDGCYRAFTRINKDFLFDEKGTDKVIKWGRIFWHFVLSMDQKNHEWKDSCYKNLKKWIKKAREWRTRVGTALRRLRVTVNDERLGGSRKESTLQKSSKWRWHKSSTVL